MNFLKWSKTEGFWNLLSPINNQDIKIVMQNQDWKNNLKTFTDMSDDLLKWKLSESKNKDPFKILAALATYCVRNVAAFTENSKWSSKPNMMWSLLLMYLLNLKNSFKFSKVENSLLEFEDCRCVSA